MSNYYAVLTGDIINSSKMSVEKLKSVRKQLRNHAKKLNGFKYGLVIGNIDFFRGDGWQLLLKNPRYALRSILYLRAALIGFEQADTRISVGIGKIDHIDNKVSRSTGAAFTYSGEALDQMKHKDRMCIKLSQEDQPDEVMLKAIFILCDALTKHWRTRQAEAVVGALEGLTQAEIANRLSPPVSQQAVKKLHENAQIQAIERVLRIIENR